MSILHQNIASQSAYPSTMSTCSQCYLILFQIFYDLVRQINSKTPEKTEKKKKRGCLLLQLTVLYSTRTPTALIITKFACNHLIGIGHCMLLFSCYVPIDDMMFCLQVYIVQIFYYACSVHHIMSQLLYVTNLFVSIHNQYLAAVFHIRSMQDI